MELLWDPLQKMRNLDTIWDMVTAPQGDGLKWNSPMSVLISFMSAWHELESLGRRTLNWDNVSIKFVSRQVCKLFSWLMLPVGGPCSQRTMSPLGRWSYESRLSKAWGASPYAAFLQSLYFSSHSHVPARVPDLNSISDGGWPVTCKLS